MVRSIFKYAIMMEYCDNDTTQCMEIRFKHITANTRHLPAIIDTQEFGKFLNKIADNTYSAGVKLCLLIMAYLPLRSTEMRWARWSEIDLKQAEWTIPTTRAEDKRMEAK